MTSHKIVSMIAIVLGFSLNASAATLAKCTGSSPNVPGDHSFRIHILKNASGDLKATLLLGQTIMNTWATYSVTEKNGRMVGQTRAGEQFDALIGHTSGTILALSAPAVAADGGSVSGGHEPGGIELKNVDLTCE